MKNQKQFDEIILKLCSKTLDHQQDDMVSILKGYKELLNFMKSSILEFETLIKISNIILYHLRKENNEIIIVKVLEATNYLIDFLSGESQDQQSADILNELLETLLGKKLIGSGGGLDNQLEKEILENIQNIISSIIQNYNFNIILSVLENGFNCNGSGNGSGSDKVLYENYLKIICFLIESSVIQVVQLKSLFNGIVKLLKYPDCQSYPSLYKLITLIFHDMGDYFFTLHEINFDNQDPSIKKVLLQLFYNYKQQKQQQQQRHNNSGDIYKDVLISDDDVDDFGGEQQQQQQHNEEDDYMMDDDENSGVHNSSIGSNNNTSNISNNNNSSGSLKSNITRTTTTTNSLQKISRPVVAKSIKEKEEQEKFSQLSKKKLNGVPDKFYKNLTESEFENKMNEIIAVLENSESEWNVKLVNILKFQSIIRSGACKFSNFPNVFNRFRDLLTAAILDKRSTLMKEACLALSAISEQLEHAFEPYLEKYFDILLKCIIVSTKIISESSDQCIKCIISTTKSCKIIPRICEAISTDKSTILRSRCIEYLYILLCNYPALSEKYFDQIDKSIRLGAIDAQPTVRSFARLAYFQYSLNWPSKSNTLFSSLDPVAQKNIQKEQKEQQQKEQQQSQRPPILSNINKPTIKTTPTTTTKILPHSTSQQISNNNPFLNVQPTTIKSTNDNNVPSFQIGRPMIKPSSSSFSSIQPKTTFSSLINKKIMSNTPTTTITTPIHKNNNVQLPTTPINIYNVSTSSSSDNVSSEKKRLLSNAFEDENSTTSRKKQMLSHPSSPSFKKIGEPKRVLIQEDKNLHSFGLPKRIASSAAPSTTPATTTTQPLSTITNQKLSNCTTESSSTNKLNTLISKQPTFKPIANNTSTSFSTSRQPLKPTTSNNISRTTGEPIKNYVKDMMVNQKKLITVKPKSSLELKVSDLHN